MGRGRRAAQVGSVAVVVLLAVLVLIGQPGAPAHLISVVTTPSPSPVESPTSAPWDLDADIGAVMVASWRGAASWSDVRPMLVDNRMGGALLFTANFGGYPNGLKEWTDRLTAMASSACFDHPMLVMLDEEGGSVANVKADFAPPWPLEMAAGGPDRVRELERLNGAGLRASGVGLNLAPVADVRTNSLDGIIGARSFGSSPSVVRRAILTSLFPPTGSRRRSGSGCSCRVFKPGSQLAPMR